MHKNRYGERNKEEDLGRRNENPALKSEKNPAAKTTSNIENPK